MRRLRFAPFVFGVVLGTALSSSASPGHAMRACRSDIETLCPDAHGRFEVGECLRANKAELSEECFAVHNAKEACRADAEALCPEHGTRARCGHTYTRTRPNFHRSARRWSKPDVSAGRRVKPRWPRSVRMPNRGPSEERVSRSMSRNYPRVATRTAASPTAHGSEPLHCT